MSIGLSGSYSSNKSTSRSIPKWAEPFFKEAMDAGSSLLGRFDPYQQTDDNRAAEAEIRKTLAGSYLKADSNPYVGGMADEVTRRSREFLNTALARIGAGSQTGGTLESSYTPRIQAQAVRQSADDLSGNLTSLFSDNYTRERDNQLKSVDQSLGLAERPFDLAERILAILRGTGTSKSRGASYGGSVSAGYG